MTADSLAAALEREHGEIDLGVERFDTDPGSSESAKALAAAIAALRRHIYLEEEFLFPALGGDGAQNPGGLVAPIFVMLREHAQMWQLLDQLEPLLAAEYQTTAWNLCHQLAAQLQHHNMKEERIIYPAADQLLTTAVASRLHEFLASGRLPDGWVCVKART